MVALEQNTIEINDFEGMTDEDIIKLIRKNNNGLASEYLVNKYKNLVKIKARSYFLMGSDHDDIIQEGMVGLFKAIRDFEPERKAPFIAFAELCITRQIYSAIKSASRNKHKPLNSYVSLNRPVFESDSYHTYIDFLPMETSSDPAEIFIQREDRNYIETRITKSLSSFEATVLSLYLQGRSYIEIATITKKQIKSVDNALQRIKRKVTQFVKEKTLDAY